MPAYTHPVHAIGMPPVSVSVGTSPKGPAFVEVSLKLPLLLGTKTYQIPRSEAQWIYDALGAILNPR